MDDQPSLFDAKKGEALREEAIERVESNAKKDFLICAFECVSQLAREHEWFTTDDVWALLAQFPAEYRTHEPRAMGPVMRRAVVEKLAKPADNWILSKRPACHRRPLRVWLSLVHTARVSRENRQ